MPTSMEEHYVDETARASDIAWVDREFDTHHRNSAADDTTLSGSLFVAALEDFKKSQKTASPSECILSPPRRESVNSNNNDGDHSRMLNQSVSLLGSPELLLPTTPDPPSVNKTRPMTSTQKQLRAVHASKLPPGPNQQMYQAKYMHFVKNVIEECRTKHPHSNVHYNDLSTEQQTKEQERVLRLLERLQVGSEFAGKKATDLDATPSQQPKLTQRKSLSFAMNDSQSLLPHPVDDPMDTSIALLSPIPPQQDDINDSLSPIEVTRAAATAGFSSPRPLLVDEADKDNDDHIYKENNLPRYNKRMATTSGKRGTDASRQKRGSDTFLTTLGEFHSPSPPATKAFTASQSPILSDNDMQHTAGMMEDSLSSSATELSFAQLGNHDLDSDDRDTTFDSTDEIESSSVSSFVRPPFQGSVANQLHLQQGVAVHFQPLETKRRRPKSRTLTQTFPDPLSIYQDKEFDNMQSTYKWLKRRLSRNSSTALSGAVVFSLSVGQIITMSLKLAARVESNNDDYHDHDRRQETSPVGQTLVVVRERQSLERWKQAFRERSHLGVLSHCELPLKERRSVSTTKKCTHYGVVLTTFDALSSADVTMVVSEKEGHALVEQSQASGGWYHGRGTTASQGDRPPTNCKRVSVLHRLTWNQVVFVDELGRKSFLAKPDTSRNNAASLLAAKSRAIFFAKTSSDSPTGFAELIKSDRKALSGVAAVLHTDWEKISDGDSSGRGIALDFEQVVDRVRS